MMRIIDLFNKYDENYESIPAHIKYNDIDLYYNGSDYISKSFTYNLFDLLADRNKNLDHIFDDIEVIEDSENLVKTIDDKDLVSVLERLEKYVFNNQTDDVKDDWKYVLVYILKSKLQK